MAEAMIAFKNVTKQYSGGQPAVGNLSMSLDPGAITVFVGPSGCGKTTSLRMINRMVEPTSGTITVGGQDVTSVPRLNGVPKADARKRARELLGVVGLGSPLGERYPSELSGGQQQRVGVARAPAADPPVLLRGRPGASPEAVPPTRGLFPAEPEPAGFG